MFMCGCHLSFHSFVGINAIVLNFQSTQDIDLITWRIINYLTLLCYQLNSYTCPQPKGKLK